MHHLHLLLFFFFNDTATTEIYTLSLHDALPISSQNHGFGVSEKDIEKNPDVEVTHLHLNDNTIMGRSEEHTSELQSRLHLVCRLLLEKKKKKQNKAII